MPKQFFRSVLIVSACMTIATPSYSVIYVDKVDHPRKVVILKIEGRIKYEDEIEFQRTLDEIKRDGYKIKLNSVVLNTRGGSTSAAMEIGKIIRKEKLNTYVGPKHVCASACIYVLSSGIVRMAYGDVSVHRSSFNDEFPIEKVEKALVENDIEKMNYLYEMGMTTQLVEAIKVTPHWTRWTLDEKEKRRWGCMALSAYTRNFGSELLPKPSSTTQM